MEKEGLERVLNFLHLHELSVSVIVTDRHKQINKWLRETHPDIKHYYDAWHVAKGTTKNNYNVYILVTILLQSFL